MPLAVLRTLEAVIALAVAQATVRLLPFRATARLAGAVHRGAPAAPADQSSGDPVARAVGAAITRGSRLLPWTSTCLVRALGGSLMLQARRRRSAIVLGVTSDNGKLLAHAWLVTDGQTVCGGREAAGFSPIATLARASVHR